MKRWNEKQNENHKICCIGAGYVGAYNVIAQNVHIQVTVVDLNVEQLRLGMMRIWIFLFTNQDWIKLLGKQEEETYSFLRMWKSN
jgi:S-adenosylmethionine:diacylglycerol 3-amino-3-carboxypropyl transferase